MGPSDLLCGVETHSSDLLNDVAHPYCKWPILWDAL